METTTDAVRLAEQRIGALAAAATRYGEARALEMELEDDRPLVKARAVKRIMERDGIAATPAEKIVESDEEYVMHRTKQRRVVVAVQEARAAYDAAKLRAELTVAIAGAAA